ncbi:MAG: redox-regulated ATPase YchF [Candidatus Kerfeldbacteria bacterium]|nr:redox-regulated ATPase YchF [Candidatus Kerfeldbacteria bacterium]
MSFSVGIVGLPNVGKSSLFQALTKKQVDTSNYPFATIDPNVGVVAVPDERLERLTALEHSAKTVPTTIEFVDIAGLVKGAHQGEGLGNKFLSHVREVDAIVEVVRAFDDPNVIHVAGQVNPQSDVETIGIELAMADLGVVDRRLANIGLEKKAGLTKTLAAELALMEKLRHHLSDGHPIRNLLFTDDEQLRLKPFNLLTEKPLLYVLNVSEEQVKTAAASAFGLPADRTIIMAVKTEQELVDLPPAEAAAYLRELGLKQSGLDRLVAAAYHALRLVTFLTTGPDETRAWTVPAGTKSPAAAGVIHTDFAKHFVRAEIVNYGGLIAAGSWEGAKKSGQLRIEGKEYEIRDGDVVYFRTTA